MRKVMLRVFIICMMLIVALMPLSVSGIRSTFMDFRLSDNDGGRHYALDGFGPDAEIIEIPAEYNGKPVGELYGNPFEQVKPTDAIQKVYLTENLYSLFRITLPNKNQYYTEYENGRYIGTKDNPYYALNDVIDDDVKEFKLHPDTEIIAGYAFRGVQRLEKLILSDNLKYIRYDALNCHTDLEGMIYSNFQYTEYGNCRYIGSATNPYYALLDVADADALSITIHEDTRIIMPNAFCHQVHNLESIDCDKLRSITIPKSVISIGRGAFEGCPNLKEINFVADSIDDLKICEIGIDMPENAIINWGFGKEENVSMEPSVSDDGGYVPAVWIVASGIFGVLIGATAVLLIKRKKA